LQPGKGLSIKDFRSQKVAHCGHLIADKGGGSSGVAKGGK